MTRRAFHFAVGQTAPADALANCLNGQAELLRHGAATAMMNLPEIVGAPDWYVDFTGSWVNIAAHAAEWRDALSAEIQSVPRQLSGFSEIFLKEQAEIGALLDRLQAQPGDADARSALAKKIALLAELADGGVNDTAVVRRNVVGFGAKIAPDRDLLRAANAAALATIARDQQAVDKLNSDIAALNARIDSDKALIAAGGVELGLGLLVAVAGVVVLARFAPGPAQVGFVRGLVVFGAVTATSGIVTMILAGEDMKRAKEQIDSDVTEIQSLDTQIAALQAFERQAADLADAADANSADLTEILTGWDALAGEVAELSRTLQDETRDLDADDFASLRADLRAAAEHWREVQSTASILATIPITVETSPRWIGT